jgi:hypothetical protein
METNVKYTGPIVNTKTHSETKTCFGCLYNENRYCTWFTVHRSETARGIPNTVFDKGCKLREPTVENQEHDEITKLIIKLFDGEITEKQVVRRDRPWKGRWNSLHKRKR